MPNIQATMDTTLTVALYEDLPELNETACYVYNPWVVMCQLIKSERTVNGAEASERLRQQILDKAPELVEASVNKMVTHIVDGGGFSYTELLPCNTSQGAPVACAVEPEADVNANTLYISSTVDAMLSALGADDIPIWCNTDYYYFLNVLTALGPTVKKEIYIPDVEPISFDDYIEEPAKNEAEFRPHEEVFIKIPDNEFFNSSIVSDPETGLSSDKTLRLETVVKTDEDGNEVVARSPSSTFVHFSNSAMDGDCYIFETNFRVDSVMKQNHPILQIFFTNLAMSYVSGFNVSVTEHRGAPAIKISDGYAGLDGTSNTNVYTGQGLGEWFKLRFELYKLYTPIEGDNLIEDELLMNLDVKIKVYVNGEYVCTSDSGRILATKPESVADSKIDQILLSAYRTNASVMYFDNLYVAKSNIKYEPVVVYDPETPNIPDTPIDPESDHIYVAEFDNGILNDAYLHSYIPDGGKLNVMAPNINPADYADRISYSLATDVYGRAGAVLKVQTVKQSKFAYGQSDVKISNTLPKGTTATFEMKAYFEDAGKTTTFTQLFFKTQDNKKLASINIMNSDKGYLYLSQNNEAEGDIPGTGANVIIPGAYLPVNRWITLRAVFYHTGNTETMRMKLYTDAGDGETMRCISDVACYSPKAIESEKTVYRVEIAHQRTAALTSYFDDVYLTLTDTEYAQEELYPLSSLDVIDKNIEPDEPEYPDEPYETVIDFEGGAIKGDYFNVTAGKITSEGVAAGKPEHNAIDDGDSEGGNLNTYLELRDDVEGKVGNRVLHVTQSAAEQKNYGYTETVIGETSGPGEGYIYTFRAEMRFDYLSIASTALIAQMYFGDKAYPSIFVFALPEKARGVWLSFGYEYNVQGYIPYDEWVTIEIVYEAPVRGDADEYNMYFFIKSSKTDNELKCVYTARAKTNDMLMASPAYMDKMLITHYRSGEASYYLDNITFTRNAENENLT